MTTSASAKLSAKPLRRTVLSGTGTFTFLTTATRYRVLQVGAGGGGGKADGSGPATNGSGMGGGGGAFDEWWGDVGETGGSITYAMGTKGVGRTGTPGPGTNGTATRVHRRITAGGLGGQNGRVNPTNASSVSALMNGALPTVAGNPWAQISSTGVQFSLPLSSYGGIAGGDGGYAPSGGGAGLGGLAPGAKYWWDGAQLNDPGIGGLRLSSGGTSSTYDGGGGGGSTPFGTGGTGGNGHSTAPTAGANAAGYGAGGGGGGGCGSGTNNGGNGGDGTDGTAIVEEYP
jgi:hypothetical protein